MEISSITLLELNQKIKKIIRDNNNSFWVVAEISELKTNFSGHCYLELIQKDEVKDQIVARSRATIWATTYRMIKPYFESTTKQALKEGIAILVRVTIEFHEIYGLSLNIIDIEPTYTVGEMAMRKQKIIEKLQEEGVFDMNKGLVLPDLCQRIAVISSKTAAGYEDFEDQLLNNQYGYKYYSKLFPAIMQGDDAEKSIIAALDKIYQYESVFDAVVIIRGGGSQADLNCFNNYWIAYNITQFPIPVLTGIGHEQDDSVADLVAHTRLKTPTAVASFLIEHLAETDVRLQETQKIFIQEVQKIMDKNRDELSQLAQNLQNCIKDTSMNLYNELMAVQHTLETISHRSIYRHNLSLLRTESTLKLVSSNVFNKSSYSLDTIGKIILRSLKHSLALEKQKIDQYTNRTIALNPESILKRGYSITLKNGKAVKDPTLLTDGDLLETILHKGKISSILKKN